jgi:hypothetical protein
MNKNYTDDFNTQVQCEEVYVTESEANEEMAEAFQALPANTNRRVIDLTPSWEEAVNICMTVLESSANEEAKEMCRQELRRLARHVDQHQSKKESEGYEL